jgi:glycosyltransferase involved in cell wall biosynthesis
VLQYPCRRIVFVQASSFIATGLRAASGYRELGYSGAMATMPHVQAIVERHYGVAAAIVPPCVAPYFFLRRGQLERARRRQLALIPKEWCRDFSIVQQMLRDHSEALGWRVVELGQKSHRQVARALRQAAFHVNVNCHESFNATVPEAMAAGCLPICYEAFGGRDYLRDGENAFVFPTHDAYGLLERTLELMTSYDRMERQLGEMRRAAMTTALNYTERHTERALLEYFEPLIAEARRRERK